MDIQALHDVVHNSRDARRQQTLPKLSPADRDTLIKKFHPDYREAAYRPLAVGPNEGDLTVRELATVLEGDSVVSDALPLTPDHEVDVLVVGGGGAGCAAALHAHEQGAEVLLATKLRLADSNSVMAQGGMQIAVAPDDSPVQHFLDTLKGGHMKNDHRLLRTMVEEGPSVAKWLLELGVLFDRDLDGNLHVNKGGGSTRARLLTCSDYTGLEIMRVLKDEVLNRKIRLLEFAAAVELLSDESGACAGAVLQDLDNKRFLVVAAKTVILATGGIGRLHIQGFPTSNHYGATGDGLALAYRIGAPLVQIDTFQYHPSGGVYPEQLVGQLVTEGIRSEGGHLVNAKGERFVNELDTRDVVSSSIIRECEEGRGVRMPTGRIGVWLDTPLLEVEHGEGTLDKHFPAMVRQYARYGVDIPQRSGPDLSDAALSERGREDRRQRRNVREASVRGRRNLRGAARTQSSDGEFVVGSDGLWQARGGDGGGTRARHFSRPVDGEPFAAIPIRSEKAQGHQSGRVAGGAARLYRTAVAGW